jgi:hypothetical protein
MGSPLVFIVTEPSRRRKQFPARVRAKLQVMAREIYLQARAQVRPNPSVEPTPDRVAPWPGAGYKVHSPAPGQGATLPGSSHLKR